MKSFAITVIALACLLLSGSASRADITFEVTAASTLGPYSGYELTISEPSSPDFTYFVFEDAGMIRVYAFKIEGLVDWTLVTGEQFLCPATSMNINDTWRFIDDGVSETVATVAAQEAVDTDAGTFSCYRVDIEWVDDPGTVRESLWFSSGAGLIQDRDFYDGTQESNWQAELIDYIIVAGLGYFPLAVGNIWTYKETYLPVAASTWGAIKSAYR